MSEGITQFQGAGFAIAGREPEDLNNHFAVIDASSERRFVVAGASAAARVCDPCQLQEEAQGKRNGDTRDTAYKEAAMQQSAQSKSN